MKHLESRESQCVHRPKILNVSVGPGFETLSEWIRFLYYNVIDHLVEVTSQSTNDLRVQMLRPDTNQLALIRDLTMQ